LSTIYVTKSKNEPLTCCWYVNFGPYTVDYHQWWS